MTDKIHVVITRMGKGDVWRFEDYETADEHPIRQYGDALMAGPEDVLRQYPLELDWLASKCDVMSSAPELIWKGLVRVARTPPKDPREVCRIIIEDRRITKTPEFNKMARKKKQVEGAEATETVTAEPKARKARLQNSQVITLGQNAEGVAYGPDNNPKKGKAADRFALYRDGMTIGEAKEAGLTSADFHWDIERGLISVSAPSAAEEVETAEAA